MSEVKPTLEDMVKNWDKKENNGDLFAHADTDMLLICIKVWLNDNVVICDFNGEKDEDYCHRGYLWNDGGKCPRCEGLGWYLAEEKREG